MLDEIRRLAWEKFQANWPAMKLAPITSIVLLVAGGYIGYQISSWRYEGAVQNLESAVKAKDATISNLQNQISANPRGVPEPMRDPDAIYQLGRRVGLIQQAKIEESSGAAFFGAIVEAARFNAKADFEYRDYVLRLKHAAAESSASMAGTVQRSFHQVTCEIIGRANAR